MPKTAEEMWPFMTIGIGFCLLLHHFMPNKFKATLTMNDRLVIWTNLFMTAAYAKVYIHYASLTGHLVPVNSYTDIPPHEVLYVLLFILSDEVIFFLVHKWAHTKSVYGSWWYGHKMHHKFLNTSAWTSFYANPVDHFLSVLTAALLLPMLMMKNGIDISVPTLTAFMFGAVTTFVGSHHCVVKEEKGKKKAGGGDHLVHHQKFTVNYGNFGYFDFWYGSYVGKKFDSWKKGK
ncbi:hypothetical protein TrRE_jg10603 [Triparma retinervis]|uniref:Fatty acid hydroxylase domain-containing protein n=1 Tax=Triparma retinervis TaxID=2557542 RepID=A0A9W7EA54_9STRA|nr:hypothetical protein TrRE_jg10603 [Triparma retinervis]